MASPADPPIEGDLITEDDGGAGRVVDDDDTRFVARLLISTGGVWGGLAWGSMLWGSGWEWLDLSDRVRGATWKRGGDPLEGRPTVGTASIDLDSDDGYLSPWDDASAFPGDRRAHLTAGTVLQLGWVLGGVTWVPAWTGTIDRLAELGADLDADVWVHIEATETIGTLAGIDREESAGSGVETFAVRMARLLADAQWSYGSNLDAVPLTGSSLQSTAMAQNRLGEVYLTGDSVGMDVYTERNGRLTARPRGLFAPLAPAAAPLTPWAVGEVDDTVVWDATTLVVVPWAAPPAAAVDDAVIVNRWAYARVGGTTQVATDGVSIAWHGEHDAHRSDLITNTDALVLELVGYLAATVEPDARAYTIDSLELDADLVGLELVTALDLHRGLYVLRSWERYPARSDVLFRCAVGAYEVSVVATGPDRAQVTATVDVAVLELRPPDPKGTLMIANVADGLPVDPDWGNAIRDATVQVCTSGARPGAPAEGMVIYETDTNKVWVYNGAAWYELTGDAGWTFFTPTVSGTVGGAVALNANASYFVRRGRLIHARYAFRLAATFTGTLEIALPVAGALLPSATFDAYNACPCGEFFVFDRSALRLFSGIARMQSATVMQVESTDAAPTVAWTPTVPVTIAAGAKTVGDEFFGRITYEPAA